MDHYLVIGIAAAFFIIFFAWGIIFIVRGYRASAEEKSAVPISDLKEITEFKNAYMSKQEMASSSVEEDESLKKEDLAIRSLEQQKEPEEVLEDKEAQLVEAQQTIERLKGENQLLNIQIEEQELKVSHIERDVDNIRHKFEESQRKEHMAIQEWEGEITRIRCEKENVLQDRERLVKLETENQTLIAQLRKGEQNIAALQENLRLVEKENEQKLNEANAIINSLNTKEAQRVQSQGTLNEQLSESKETIETLQQEREQMVHAKADLETELKKIKDFNARLLEKEKMLQYELTKNRAQALGLERICEDFKIQIDVMSKPR
jgi:chromosome segregation ATPase